MYFIKYILCINVKNMELQENNFNINPLMMVLLIYMTFTCIIIF